VVVLAVVVDREDKDDFLEAVIFSTPLVVLVVLVVEDLATINHRQMVLAVLRGVILTLVQVVLVGTVLLILVVLVVLVGMEITEIGQAVVLVELLVLLGEL
tara:strand:+ start:233 stop:535 length:303 start_codon:yes stop_codon:yes gene_type:complete